MRLLKAELQAFQSAPFLPGEARIGRYEVLALLGPAAMGATYKAIDQTGRTVAITTFELDRAGEGRAEFAAHFYREANEARLSHAHIVTIRDVGEADGVAYIATDYPEGESLRELLDAGAVLSIQQVVKIAAGVADALNHAHENHVVHGDIKPENIVIAPGGDAKIMNFGVAQAPAWPLQLATTLGTSGYMAPEQVAGGSTDGRADIFALGAVLYEMLTGAAPFNDDDPGAIPDKILKGKPVPPSTLNARVPLVFDRIIDRALAKRPKDRYQTGSAFSRDLQTPAADGPAASSNDAAMAVRAVAPGAGPRNGLAVIPPSAQGAGIHDLPAGRLRPRLKPLLLAIPILLVAAWVIYPHSPQPHPNEREAVLPKPAAALPRPAAALPEPAVAVQPTDLAPTGDAAIPAVSPDANGVPEPPHVTAPVPAKPAKATLTLAISPWGAVYVDGKSVGVSPPLTTLQLDAGKHRVEIRNQALEPYRRTVNLKPGEPLKIKHKFR